MPAVCPHLPQLADGRHPARQGAPRQRLGHLPHRLPGLPQDPRAAAGALGRAVVFPERASGLLWLCHLAEQLPAPGCHQGQRGKHGACGSPLRVIGGWLRCSMKCQATGVEQTDKSSNAPIIINTMLCTERRLSPLGFPSPLCANQVNSCMHIVITAVACRNKTQLYTT
jgi:hypothetical protein